MSDEFDTSELVPVCSICGKEIVRLYDGIQLEEGCMEGTASWLSHGYGSDFDMECWLVCFCSACLMKMKPLKIFDYMDGFEVEDT